MIHNYKDFLLHLHQAGFSMAGGNPDGIYSVVDGSWYDEMPIDSPIRWHTGDLETDPWEWRMRVLEEQDDIAYAKLFFKKSGYITKKWYPYFIAARRGTRDFIEYYESGTISYFAKRIYEVVSQEGVLSVPEIKQSAGFSREDKSGFDRALTELQMGMFLTMCGQKSRFPMTENQNCWTSTVFCTVERFFGEEFIHEACLINQAEAYNKIREQILRLNPDATDKKIKKFIFGGYIYEHTLCRR